MAQLRDWLLWAGGAGLALGTQNLGRRSSGIPPSALQNSSPKSQSLGEFSSPAASPASVEAAMNQQQNSPSLMQMLVCTNHPLPALEDHYQI